MKKIIAGNTRLSRLIILTAAILLSWAFIGLLLSVVTIIMLHLQRVPSAWFPNLIFEWGCIYPWALGTPLILYTAGRYRFETKRKWVSAGMHLSVFSLIMVFHTVNQSLFVGWYFDEKVTISAIKLDMIEFLNMRIAMYVLVVIVFYAYDYYRRTRENMVKEPRLYSELNRTRLETYITRLQPSFIFGTIDSIDACLLTDKRKAEKLIYDFSELIRMNLLFIKKPYISLEDECRFLTLYINLLKSRYILNQNLKFNKDKEAKRASVPPVLLLFPLIEKIAEEYPERLIRVETMNYSCRVIDDKLHLKLAFYPLFIGDVEKQERLIPRYMEGLIHIIDSMYNGKYSFAIESHIYGWLTCSLIIPYEIFSVDNGYVGKKEQRL